MLAFPIHDSPNVRATPWMTWSLVATHLLVFVLLEWPALGDSLLTGVEDRGVGSPQGRGVFGELWRARSVWTEHAFFAEEVRLPSLLTGLFLHTGTLAALLGAFLLAMLGDNVEHHVGRPLFAGLYVGGGVIGTLLGSWMIGAAGQPPVVGSGAALGTIMGSYLVFFPRNEIRVAYLTGRPALSEHEGSGGGLPYVPAWVGVPLCAVILAWSSVFSRERAADSILAGLIVGLVAAFVLHRHFGDPSRKGDAAWYPNALLVGMPLSERVAHLLREDEIEKASMLYLESKDDPDQSIAAEDLEKIAAWLEAQGMAALADGALKRAGIARD